MLPLLYTPALSDECYEYAQQKETGAEIYQQFS